MHALVYESCRLEREVLKAVLEHEGYVGSFCDDVSAFTHHLKTSSPPLVLLGIHDLSAGLRLCRDTRAATQAPIIALSRSLDDEAVTQFYEAGTDDVIFRPFSPRLFAARIDNLFRRARYQIEATAFAADKVTIGPFKLFPTLLELHKGDKVIRLTPLQTRLLYHLMANAGRTIPKGRLEERLWGETGEIYGDPIKTHICHLRRKLEDDPREPHFIQTVKGIGYAFQN